MPLLMMLSWLSIVIGLLSALIIYVDIQMGRYQASPIMNIAWPVTALFIWPLVLMMYFKHGRAQPNSAKGHAHHHGGHGHGSQGGFAAMYVSSTHCASGCAVADIMGETLVYLLGLTLFGLAIWAGFVLDYILALLFGLVFQYYSMKPHQKEMPAGRLLWQAFKADIFSLTSFQIGMYAWMLISVYWLSNNQLNASSPVFWFMMQIAMVLGMFTTMPVNKWLIKVGIKHGCH